MAVATWVGYPASYSAGRNRSPQYVVVHYTAGSEGPTSAEDGAAYDKRRADGTSTHVFADSNSVVREVPDGDRAHSALFHGNEIGLQLELCGTAQTREQWLDDVSRATLRNGARQAAEWCKAYGFSARRLSVAETRAAYYATVGQRPKGIVGHVDVTYAYPEDGGSHTDPGEAFPWDAFLTMVIEEMGDDMTPEQAQMLKDVWHALFKEDTVDPRPDKSIARKIADIHKAVQSGGGSGPVTDEQLVEIAAAAHDGAKEGALEAAPVIVGAVDPVVRDAIADGLEGGAASVRAGA